MNNALGLGFNVLLALITTCVSGSTARAQYKFTTLASVDSTIGPLDGTDFFNGVNGGHLSADSHGNTYGTTSAGGVNGDGTIFQVAAGSHSVSLLASFNGTNGAGPYSPLVVDEGGNVFGTTAGGGPPPGNWGTVFEIDGATHTLNTLDSFDPISNPSAKGVAPRSGLVADNSGNLIGTTGVVASVFAISAGTHSFSSAFFPPLGGSPSLPMIGIADGAGNVYGVSSRSGANSDGVVFEIPSGSIGSTSVIAVFNGANGAYPNATLVADKSGNVFGTTSGDGSHILPTVFEIAAGTHNLSTLKEFSSFDSSPTSLTIDANGNLFGTTYLDGPGSAGTVFEIAAGTHAFSMLAAFNGSNGRFPDALVLDGHGNLLGTTANGGLNDQGAVFELAAGTNSILTLMRFNGANGAFPSSLTADGTGNFFGTAMSGGTNNDGTVFELSPVPEPSGLAFCVSALVVGCLLFWKRLRSPARMIWFTRLTCERARCKLV